MPRLCSQRPAERADRAQQLQLQLSCCKCAFVDDDDKKLAGPQFSEVAVVHSKPAEHPLWQFLPTLPLQDEEELHREKGCSSSEQLHKTPPSSSRYAVDGHLEMILPPEVVALQFFANDARSVWNSLLHQPWPFCDFWKHLKSGAPLLGCHVDVLLKKSAFRAVLPIGVLGPCPNDSQLNGNQAEVQHEEEAIITCLSKLRDLPPARDGVVNHLVIGFHKINLHQFKHSRFARHFVVIDKVVRASNECLCGIWLAPSVHLTLVLLPAKVQVVSSRRADLVCHATFTAVACASTRRRVIFLLGVRVEGTCRQEVDPRAGRKTTLG
mmetsp:Transcript_35017/g.75532  ORF Transcript_35017/g.75532 Transcript_35017/m.75532 type:complete len:324 (-) Transcript_35017:854-1825(-)